MFVEVPYTNKSFSLKWLDAWTFGMGVMRIALSFSLKLRIQKEANGTHT